MNINLDKLITVVRDHKDMFLASENTQLIELKDYQLSNYATNFYGLLVELKLPMQYAQCYLILNGLDSPVQEFTQPFVIAPQIEEMMQIYRNS